MRAWLAIAVCIWGTFCGADEPPKSDDQTDPVREAWSKIYLDVARKIKFASESSPETKFVIKELPLLKWHNPVRVGETHGDFFVWQRDDEPVVVGTIFSYLARGNDEYRILAMELHSLTPEILSITSPNLSGELNGENVGAFDVEIPEGTVADSASRRLLQARSVARSCEAFTVHEEVERRLRLLSQPLLVPRGESEAQGKDPTALFALVTGTDPELLILVRAVGDEGDKRHWRVTPARFTDLRLKVSVHGKEVWQWRPHSGSEPYFARHGFAVKPTDPR